MGRKVTVGIVPGGLGGLNISDGTITTAEDNGNLILSPDGTGEVQLTSDLQLNAQKDLRFADSDSTNWVAFQAPATISSNVTWTLPDAVTGTNGYALTSTTGGTLSWAATGPDHTDITTAGTYYPIFTTLTSGLLTATSVTSTKLSFAPNTGTLTVTAITESSSITLKENVSPITDGLNKIMQLVGVTYDRIDGSRKNEAGLIAEDVVQVLPNLVNTNEEGKPDSINYTKITAYLIEAVKSLKKEVDDLKGDR